MTERKRPDRARSLSAGVGKLERLEWESEPLVELLGDHLARSLDSPYWTDERFVTWQANDVRSRGATVDTWAASRIDALARRIEERALEERWSVRCFEDIPDGHPAPIIAGARECLERAISEGCALEFPLGVAAGAGRELWDEPCERWVRLPRGVPAGPHVTLTVAGDSMEPLLGAGDVVLLRLGARVRPGTVVVARHPENGYVVKALADIRRERLELVSLNAAFAPVTIRRSEGAVLGTVVGRWRMRDTPRRSG